MKRLTLILFVLFVSASNVAFTQDTEWKPPSRKVLTPQQWQQVDTSVDKGLAWLASQQRVDGSFPAPNSGQPGITSLGVMSFLSRGHRPGMGPYGETINKAIDFVLEQQQENGLLYGGSTAMPSTDWQNGSHTATYNHAIAGLMLGEAYGMTNGKRANKVKTAIQNALGFARQLQRRPSPYEKDKYGWRYLKHHGRANKGEADLSVTGWYIMFYRSAKNAEFEVPQEYVNDAIQYVRHSYAASEGGFLYGAYGRDRRSNCTMNGAGVLCLTVTGNYDKAIIDAATDSINAHGFGRYNQMAENHDRYHYGAYYCSQAMFLVGGKKWEKFYPVLANTLVQNQSPDGSWQTEKYDVYFGNSYTTALAILSMTPPYQMLPIYQR